MEIALGRAGSALDSRSTADWAYGELSGRIVRGDLQPGSRVTEEALSAELGVSRTPLRDALRRLEMIGLIVRSRNRGLRVASLSIAEMLLLSATRESLEGLMVRQATERHKAGEVTLATVDKLLGQMESLATVGAVELLLSLGAAFHAEIRALSGNPVGAQLLEQVLVRFERYRHLIQDDAERAHELVVEHRSVVECIRAGDPDAAEALMRGHIRRARGVYHARLTGILAFSASQEQRPARGK